MARVTVEDCEAVVPNRFQLVVLANQRVKQFQNGATLTVSRDNDKDPVVALREIAYQTISINDLKEDAINAFRQTIETNDDDDFVDDDNYDPSVFSVTPNQDSENNAEEADDDSLEPEASIDFSCLIKDAED